MEKSNSSSVGLGTSPETSADIVRDGIVSFVSVTYSVRVQSKATGINIENSSDHGDAESTGKTFYLW